MLIHLYRQGGWGIVLLYVLRFPATISIKKNCESVIHHGVLLCGGVGAGDQG